MLNVPFDECYVQLVTQTSGKQWNVSISLESLFTQSIPTSLLSLLPVRILFSP